MLRLLKSKLPFDQLDQGVSDFSVAGDRGFSPIAGVRINVMTRTVAVEITPSFNERPHEFVAVHKSTPTSMVRAPACSGPGSASSIMR